MCNSRKNGRYGKMKKTQKTEAANFYKEALKNLKWLSLTGNINFNYLAGITSDRKAKVRVRAA